MGTNGTIVLNYQESIEAFDDQGSINKVVTYLVEKGDMFSKDSIRIDFGNNARYYMCDLFDDKSGLQKRSFGKLCLDQAGRNHRGSSVWVNTKDVLHLPMVQAYLAVRECEKYDEELTRYIEVQEDDQLVYIDTKEEEPVPNQWFMLGESLLNLGDISSLNYIKGGTLLRIFIKSSKYFDFDCDQDSYIELLNSWIEYSRYKKRLILVFPFIGISFETTSVGLITYRENTNKIVIQFKNGMYLSKEISKEDYMEILYLSRNELIPSSELKLEKEEK